MDGVGVSSGAGCARPIFARQNANMIRTNRLKVFFIIGSPMVCLKLGYG